MRRTSTLFIRSASVLAPSGALLIGCFSGSSGGGSPDANFTEPDTATFDQETPDAEAGPMMMMDATMEAAPDVTPAMDVTPPMEAAMEASVIDAGVDVMEAAVIDAPADVAEEEAGILSGTFATGPVNFPPIACGSPGPSGSYTFKNTGTLPITWSAALTQGTFFTILGPSSGTVMPGATGTLTVAAGTVPAATTAGTTFNDTLTLTTNVPGYTTISVPLSATAAGGTLALVPNTVGFGQVQLSKTTPLPFALTNVGNAPVSVAVGTPSDPQFALGYTGAPGAVTLQPSATLVGAQAAFAPSAIGTQQATSTITTTGAICGTSVTSIPMNGVGTTAPVTVTPGLVDFGTVACGQKSMVNGAVTITNGYSFSITYTATLGLGGASPYTIDVPSGTVAASGTTVLHLSAATIPVPGNVSPNAYGDTLTVTTNAPSTPPASVTIDESASGAILGLSMTSANFNNVTANSTGSLPFTVNNTGNAPAHLTLSTSGAGFSAAFGAGGSTANASGSASGSAVFTPSTPGTASGTMTISTTDVLCSAPLAAVTLAANALVPVASYPGTPMSVSVVCGQGASALQSLAITNNGNTPLTLSNISSQGGRLSISAVPQPIPPGQTGYITFTANAATIGTDPGGSVYSDAVVFTTNELGTPTHSVPVQISIDGANLELVDANNVPTNIVNISACFTSTTYGILNTGNVPVFVQGGSAGGYTYPCGNDVEAENNFYAQCFSGSSNSALQISQGATVFDYMTINSPGGTVCSGTSQYTWFVFTDANCNPAPVCIPPQPLVVNWSLPTTMQSSSTTPTCSPCNAGFCGGG
jgi:hypothetical protein